MHHVIVTDTGTGEQYFSISAWYYNYGKDKGLPALETCSKLLRPDHKKIYHETKIAVTWEEYVRFMHIYQRLIDEPELDTFFRERFSETKPPTPEGKPLTKPPGKKDFGMGKKMDFGSTRNPKKTLNVVDGANEADGDQDLAAMLDEQWGFSEPTPPGLEKQPSPPPRSLETDFEEFEDSGIWPHRTFPSSLHLHELLLRKWEAEKTKESPNFKEVYKYAQQVALLLCLNLKPPKGRKKRDIIIDLIQRGYLHAVRSLESTQFLKWAVIPILGKVFKSTFSAKKYEF